MQKALAILSIREDITKNIIFEEIKTLAEMYNVYIEDFKSNEVILRGNLENILEMSCRSVFIKELKIDGGIRFPRSYIVYKRPLERVDTCSAPLEIFLSRLLLNLSKVREGCKVLDPFSGVGGILFEARMLGAYTLGLDICEKYVKVQKRNLDYNSDQVVSDSSKFLGIMCRFDAVVSDPPYSKLSITDLDLDILYMSLVKIAHAALKSSGVLAISCICTIPIEEYLQDYDFDICCIGYQYVHKTLIRKIVKAVKL